jgi:hypothetical protein
VIWALLALPGIPIRHLTNPHTSRTQNHRFCRPARAALQRHEIAVTLRSTNGKVAKMGSRLVNGAEMEQWQYEVTAGGRSWYCIDDDRATVWMTEASVGHPKATE